MKCDVCGNTYDGLADDCRCTNYDEMPIVSVITKKSKRQQLLESKMAIANAVEDHAWAHIHAFVVLLIDQEYMTEPDVLKALEKFDENLQAPTTNA